MSANSRIIAALKRQLRRHFGIEILRTRNHNTINQRIDRLLRHYRIDVVLDVGANEGQFARGLREMGYTGQIHSFEPVAATFERLASHAAGDPSWHCHRMALGRCEGSLSMNISGPSLLASALPPSAFGSRLWDDFKVVDQVTVPLGTVDSFLAATFGDSPVRVFLKIDTQGMDIEVFEGARGSMDRIYCLLSELSMIPLYEGMRRYPEALARFESEGFSISAFFPVLETADLQVIEVDCLMVKPRRSSDAQHCPPTRMFN